MDKESGQESDLTLTREREALFANLRSEFSTPLDVITGYTEILLDELQSYQLEKYENDLQKILVSGKLLQNRVDEVLSFGTLAQKKESFDLQTFSSDLRFILLTPLNSVIGYCELILDEKSLIKHKHFINDIEKIHRAAKLFISYINEINKLAEVQWKGTDLLAQFKKSNIIIHDVIISIPILDKVVYRPKVNKGSILVVEDNEMTRDLLMRRLHHFGFHSTPCSDASKVLDEIEAGNFDLILLSIVTSKINGFEVLKKIRSHSIYYYLPVLVISPLKEIDAVVRCLEMGADDYLHKPFNPVIFKARIEASIEKKILRDKEKIYLAELKAAKQKSDDLLLNIVPETIAERLKQGEHTIVEKFSSVTAIFIDIVNFSNLSDKLNPGELIKMLNSIFIMMDELTDQCGLEKIKTIGDCYMAVAGAPIENPSHAVNVANFACSVLNMIKKINETLLFPIELRIGIHSGSCIGGVIGKKKFAYDFWGKTINIASRMESHGEPSQIHVSDATYQLLKDQFIFKKRGVIIVKGIGEMTTYFLVGHK